MCAAREQLLEAAELDFFETPLDEVIPYLATRHGFLVHFDRRAFRESGIAEPMNVTIDENGIPLSLALHLLLEPHGLICVERFDLLWITTRANAATWRDRTGLDTLQPAPGSALADALLQISRSPDFLEAPPQEVADVLALDFSLPIDFQGETHLEPGYRGTPPNVTLKIDGLRLRSILSIICDQYGFRCQQAGEGLVLQPVGFEE